MAGSDFRSIQISTQHINRRAEPTNIPAEEINTNTNGAKYTFHAPKPLKGAASTALVIYSLIMLNTAHALHKSP